MLTAQLTWTDKTQRCRYLIALGYADLAQEIAVELATEALADMGRRICPITGNHYFDDHDYY